MANIDARRRWREQQLAEQRRRFHPDVAQGGSAGIKLPPIDYNQFLSEVGNIGVEHGRSHELAAAARQSLVRFQHIAGAGPRAAATVTSRSQ